MPFVLILIAGVLIVSAYQNTHGALVTALESDVPPFVKWALAVGATASLGFVPGLQTVSRYTTALVLLVIVLKNWQAIQNGITDLGSVAALPVSSAATDPATQFATSGQGAVSVASATGGAGPAGTSPGTAVAGAGLTPDPFAHFADPSAFLASFEQGLGGFGGIV
jgi:hypothetical protein